MDDRELLELAAKAAGIGGGWDIPRGRAVPVCYRRAGGEMWSPLTDDGDALRLAVKLGLGIITRCANGGAYAGTTNRSAVVYAKDDDPYAVTRRAIVCAAAEIGKSIS